MLFPWWVIALVTVVVVIVMFQATFEIWINEPIKYEVAKWRETWVKFNTMLTVMLGLTGVLMLCESASWPYPALIAVGMLFSDARFDTGFATGRKDRKRAYLLLLSELPTAVALIVLVVWKGHIG